MNRRCRISSAWPGAFCVSAVHFSFFVLPLFAEEAPAKRSYDAYKPVEERNLFVPLAAKAGAAGSAGASGSGQVPVLTGVVYDARAGVWRGLIERTAQGEPLFVGVGDPTPGGTVLRIAIDRLVLLAPAPVEGQGEGREIEVPVGYTLAGSPAGGVADAGSNGSDRELFAPITDKLQEVIDRLKEKRGKSVDSSSSGGDNKGFGAADLGLDKKSESILGRLKDRRKRDKEGTRSSDGGEKPEKVKGKDEDKVKDETKVRGDRNE